MSWYDWLLFLHVASAFALVGAMVFFWALILATRVGGEVSPALGLTLARPGTIAVAVGTVGTIVFGVWLAIYVDGYELWDGWILASLILWAVSAETGRRAGDAFTRAARDEIAAPADRRRGVLLHGFSSAAAFVILLLMIFKPGAP